MDLRKCPRCGEMYSTSYRRCPFCEEAERPRRGGRRAADKRYTPGVRGPMILILLLVLALLSFILFGEKILDRFGGEEAPGQEEVVPPVENDPVIEEPGTEGPGGEEPIPEDPVGEEPQPPVIEDPPASDLSNAALNRTDFTMAVGETFQMVFTPDVEGVVWKSSDATVASVSETGVVRGITGGNANITATVGDVTLECIVRVRGTGSYSTDDTANASLSKTDFTLNVGESTRLSVNGTEAAVTWSIGNSSVASISSNGTVKALRSGMTTAYAKVGSKTLECIVRVR